MSVERKSRRFASNIIWHVPWLRLWQQWPSEVVGADNWLPDLALAVGV